jgi:acetyl-CoA synthetase
MGQESPGYAIRLLDAEGAAVEEAEVCVTLNPVPTGLMRGYQNDDGAFASLGSAAYRTGDVATKDEDGSPMSAAPTTCSKRPTTASARSNWKAS